MRPTPGLCRRRADVTVGSWMLAFNVTHFDDRRLCEPACSATSIGVCAPAAPWGGCCRHGRRCGQCREVLNCMRSVTRDPCQNHRRAASWQACRARAWALGGRDSQPAGASRVTRGAPAGRQVRLPGVRGPVRAAGCAAAAARARRVPAARPRPRGAPADAAADHRRQLSARGLAGARGRVNYEAEPGCHDLRVAMRALLHAALQSAHRPCLQPGLLVDGLLSRACGTRSGAPPRRFWSQSRSCCSTWVLSVC